MRGKGRLFSEVEIRRIVTLLASTDLPIAAIAVRMQCSVSAVGAINRRLGVRDYGGRRSTWQNSSQPRYA